LTPQDSRTDILVHIFSNIVLEAEIRKRLKGVEQNYHKQKLWPSDIKGKKLPLSEAEKHPDFGVTL
jgi:hypothetical protein